MTHFGFRRVPAREKATLVRNHFDTVAKRYDLMNTLLSFGIHYLWKRTAVELLELKEGDRPRRLRRDGRSLGTAPQNGSALPGGSSCMTSTGR